MATGAAGLSRNDIVSARGELIKLRKPGAAGDLRKFSRAFLEWAVWQGLVGAIQSDGGPAGTVKTLAQRLLRPSRRARR